jgi:uncharacterized protein (DUF1684 family)
MDELELLDWKRRVFGLYDAVRAGRDRADAAAAWRAGRDELFRTHPQSPLPLDARASFAGVPYFPYDARARVTADVVAADPERTELPASVGGDMAMVRFAVAQFRLAETDCEIELYWLDSYGGGLFVPFADATSGSETYGAGRYLLDTIKGADLGTEDGRVVLDFNFAYNPSCSYDPRWACPLAPPANRLPIPVRAGERMQAGT